MAGGTQFIASATTSIGNGRDKRDPPAQCATTRASSLRVSLLARAHPSCDRLRGSLRSGDMSLLPAINYHLSTTLYQLPTKT